MNKILLYFFIISLSISAYVFTYLSLKKNYDFGELVNIAKDSNLNQVVEKILIQENYLNKKIYYYYLKVFNNYFKTIKYGEFKIENNLSLVEITNILSRPSNYYRKISIIGGWENHQMEELMKKKFNEINFPSYSEIIADTYNYKSHNTMTEIFDLMKKTKQFFFSKYPNNILLNKYSIDQIMIIASLVEKEGRTDHDKKLISSVILNRLDKKIKLEIDATTIFSITKGLYKLNRKLTLKDLKRQDIYNTYYISGLPPNPICYVSRKTIEIVLENYKSYFLFYFYDSKNKNHIFSRTFKEHKKLLTEYRNSE